MIDTILRPTHRALPYALTRVAQAGILAAALCAGALAAARADAPILLRLKLAPRESIRYERSLQLLFNISAPGVAQPTRLDVRITCAQRMALEGMKNGLLVCSSAVPAATASVNGHTLPPGTPAKAYNVVWDNLGRVRYSESGMSPGAWLGIYGHDTLRLQHAFLPLGAVRAGSTWTSRGSESSVGPVAATAHGRVRSIDRIGSRTIARIENQVEGVMQVLLDSRMRPVRSAESASMRMSGPLTMTVDSDFDVDSGHVTRSSGRGSALLTLLNRARRRARQVDRGDSARIGLSITYESHLAP